MSAQIIPLVQGSAEWLAHRRQLRNASETPAVLGASPWQTPYQLWLVKTGRAEVEATEVMRRGTALEPAARHAYEIETGNVMQPLVLQEGHYSASLDGMTLGGDLILEIKAPYKGQASSLWQAVEGGEVPLHYRLQVQHQLMVSGAGMGHLWVFDGQRGLLREIAPCRADFEAIRAGWEAFAPFLATDTPPPLGERDTRERKDAAWREAAQAFTQAKVMADKAAEQAEQARAALVDLARHPRETGGGVTVTRYWRAGNVDYKAVPELKGVDLSRYRGKAREEVRVSAA